MKLVQENVCIPTGSQKKNHFENNMIRRIKWNNHISLGNLELDFTKPDGSVYNTIILAGENGSGKTTILNTLSVFLNGQSIKPFEFIDYEATGRTFHIIPLEGKEEFGFHSRFEDGNTQPEEIYSNQNNNPQKYKTDPKDVRSYGFTYSKARSGFKTQPVRAVTTEQVDAEKYEPDEEDSFTRIKQLLIDIEQQDDSAWREETKRGNISDDSYKEFYEQRSKGFRFRRAFNWFFENVKYERVDNNDKQEKRILFSKHGKEIPVDNLSTGEKQIVFRGAHLMKNLNSISNGIVMIDEPKLSMHPMWQKKILQYYRDLFTINGQQTVQMIIATHSQYVIQSALADSDNVLVIALSDNQGVIKSDKITTPCVLPTITVAETNYVVFGVQSIDYHIELYGYLQIKENKQSIKNCDDFIANSTFYNPNLHSKQDSYNGTTYQTLPTYIRNAIDHPSPRRKFTEMELKTSIELLMKLCH